MCCFSYLISSDGSIIKCIHNWVAYLDNFNISTTGEYKSVFGAWDKWACSCLKSLTSQYFVLLIWNLMLWLFLYIIIREMLLFPLTTSSKVYFCPPMPLYQVTGNLDGEVFQKSHCWFYWMCISTVQTHTPTYIHTHPLSHHPCDPSVLISQLFSLALVRFDYYSFILSQFVLPKWFIYHSCRLESSKWFSIHSQGILLIDGLERQIMQVPFNSPTDFHPYWI